MISNGKKNPLISQFHKGALIFIYKKMQYETLGHIQK